jgi:hypothetical protein
MVEEIDKWKFMFGGICNSAKDWAMDADTISKHGRV